MPFAWADFLPVAESLSKSGDEASLRAAVSRAYYGVFGEAREKAEGERGEEFSADRVHESVANYYDGSGDTARMLFAANLRRLKGSRVRADYRRNRGVDQKFAEQALTDARQLLADLSALPAGTGGAA
jgi:hypothetical protein